MFSTRFNSHSNDQSVTFSEHIADSCASSSQLTISSQHQRHHRFCLRLLLKHPDNHALSVLCGHNAMVSGSFKHALGTSAQANAFLWKWKNITTHTCGCRWDSPACSRLLCVLRSVCSGFTDSPQQPALQPVCGPHLLSHGIAEVCSHTAHAGAAGTVFV